MLQIIIVHEESKTYIREVRDLDTLSTVSQFNKAECKINLEPLKNHVNEKVLITHFIKQNDGTRLDYEHEKILSNVGIDEHGVWFLEYH